MVWYGTAKQGAARQAWLGMVWRGVAMQGKAGEDGYGMSMRGWARQARRGAAGRGMAMRGNAGNANGDGERPVAARKDGLHLNNAERHEREAK